MRVLVTGATGFVGRMLCESLTAKGHQVRAAVRSASPGGSAHEVVAVGDIGADTDWQSALSGVEGVVHAAARAHVLNDEASNAHRYFDTNTHGTRRLAEAAARAGVSRFVFVSSVKVNGEGTGREPFRATDAPAPCDPYGDSKRQAEDQLREMHAANGLPIAIVRPPLVYGPGVKANFLRMMRWADRELPLPIGAIDNRRSLVSVWNLCDLIETVLTHPAALGRTWMASDGNDLSTPQLFRGIAGALGRRSRVFSVPVSMLNLLGRVTGRSAEISRLCGSLVVDSSPARKDLQWSPPLSVEESLRRTAEWYLSERRI